MLTYLQRTQRLIGNTLKCAISKIYRQLSCLPHYSRISHPTVVRIQPSQGWDSLQLREIWEYRDLIYFLIWCDIKGRYRQMALGPLWVVIQPLFTVATSTVIFSVLAKLPSEGLPYPLFNYTALLPWTFFSAAVGRVASSLLSNQHLISKVYFPRLVVPIVSVLSGIMDFSMSLLVLVGMMGLYGIAPSIKFLTLPLFLGLAIATALAIGLWMAATLVKFRDVGAFLGYGLQAWMYATPVVYPPSLVPQQWQFIYYLNPMAGVVGGFRWALLGTKMPAWIPTLISCGLVFVLMVAGAYYFRSAERTIVDIV